MTEVESQPTAAPPVRSSEKSMVATCPFADAVASCALATFREKSPLEFQQTVVAAFVLCTEPSDVNAAASLRTLCVAAGTKFLERPSTDSSSPSAVVRDQHAEVLARKALQCFLRAEISAFTSLGSEQYHADPTRILALVPNSTPPQFALRPGSSLHFYTSSAPCGNSCVKKWGSSASARDRSGAGASSSSSSPSASSWLGVPESIRCAPHPKLHVVQRSSGQVALLAKGSTTTNPGADFPPPGTSLLSSASAAQQQQSDETRPFIIPCCSDKIAAWNFLSCWEGVSLCRHFSSGLVPASIVVGRKFSSFACQRALCCRCDLDNQMLSKQDQALCRAFAATTEEGTQQQRRRLRTSDHGDHDAGLRTHHPALLSTSVKLDDSARVAGAAATFDESRSFWWAANGVGSEILCGRTGMCVEQIDGNESKQSRLVSHREGGDVVQLLEPSQVDCARQAAVIDRLHVLLRHPLLFRNWPESDVADSFE